jgi:hypothetical protein
MTGNKPRYPWDYKIYYRVWILEAVRGVVVGRVSAVADLTTSLSPSNEPGQKMVQGKVGAASDDGSIVLMTPKNDSSASS